MDRTRDTARQKASSLYFSPPDQADRAGRGGVAPRAARRTGAARACVHAPRRCIHRVWRARAFIAWFKCGHPPDLAFSTVAHTSTNIQNIMPRMSEPFASSFDGRTHDLVRFRKQHQRKFPTSSTLYSLATSTVKYDTVYN